MAVITSEQFDSQLALTRLSYLSGLERTNAKEGPSSSVLFGRQVVRPTDKKNRWGLITLQVAQPAAKSEEWEINNNDDNNYEDLWRGTPSCASRKATDFCSHLAICGLSRPAIFYFYLYIHIFVKTLMHTMLFCQRWKVKSSLMLYFSFLSRHVLVKRILSGLQREFTVLMKESGGACCFHWAHSCI